MKIVGIILNLYLGKPTPVCQTYAYCTRHNLIDPISPADFYQFCNDNFPDLMDKVKSQLFSEM